MVQRVPRPDKSTPLLEQDGRSINQAWFDYLSYVDRQLLIGISGQPDVQLTSLANGEVLIWNATDSKWENGAN